MSPTTRPSSLQSNGQVGLAELEGQWHEGVGRQGLALGLAPRPEDVGHPRVAAVVARRLDLDVQRLVRAPFMPGPARVGLKRLFERVVGRRELARLLSFRWYLGGPSALPCSHFETVLRDNPVMRATSRLVLCGTKMQQSGSLDTRG